MGESIKVRKVGKYFLKEKLGEGAMGSVWLSQNAGLGIPVAIKLLDMTLAEEDPDFLNRFMQEGRLAGQLNHKNIVRIYDAGMEGNTAYIVMEFIEGCDTLELLEARGALPPDEVLALAISVAEALQEAHSLGIVHRDIKPDNILATTEGRIKLADLGLAKKLDDGLGASTIAGTALGTPYYIAPEQAMDALKADQRSDIYSLGATLYHLLAGVVPYEGDNSMSIMLRHTNEPLVPPQEKKPGLPESFCSVICKMMEKDPAKRYQSCEELLEDLYKLRSGQQDDLSTSEAELKRNLASGKSIRVKLKQPIEGKYKKGRNIKAGTGSRSKSKKRRATRQRNGLLFGIIAICLIGTVGIISVMATGGDAQQNVTTGTSSNSPKPPVPVKPTEEPAVNPDVSENTAAVKAFGGKEVVEEKPEIVENIDVIDLGAAFFEKPDESLIFEDGILRVSDLKKQRSIRFPSVQSFSDFRAVVEYKSLKKHADSGFHFMLDRGKYYEVQFGTTASYNVGQLFARGGYFYEYEGSRVYGAKFIADHEKPLGEWNRVEVLVKDESVTTWVNDVKLYTIPIKTYNPGKVGLSIWYKCEMEIRKLEITPIK